MQSRLRIGVHVEGEWPRRSDEDGPGQPNSRTSRDRPIQMANNGSVSMGYPSPLCGASETHVAVRFFPVHIIETLLQRPRALFPRPGPAE